VYREWLVAFYRELMASLRRRSWHTQVAVRWTLGWGGSVVRVEICGEESGYTAYAYRRRDPKKEARRCLDRFAAAKRRGRLSRYLSRRYLLR